MCVCEGQIKKERDRRREKIVQPIRQGERDKGIECVGGIEEEKVCVCMKEI